MITGAIVWCTIWANLSIGEGVQTYETAAKGRITKVEGETVWVDFSRYAKEQSYLGDHYYNVKLDKFECTHE
jgi:hypothetical protein